MEVVDHPHGVGADDSGAFCPGGVAGLILENLRFFAQISESLRDNDQGLDPGIHTRFNRRKDLASVQGYDGEVDRFPDVFDRRITADAQNLPGVRVDGINLALVAIELKAFKDIESSRAGFPRHPQDGHGLGFEE